MVVQRQLGRAVRALTLSCLLAPALAACGARDGLFVFGDKDHGGTGGMIQPIVGRAGHGGGGASGAGAGGSAQGGMTGGAGAAGMTGGAGAAGMTCQGGGPGQGPTPVLLPGGSFVMGSDDGDPDEQPRTTIGVTSFELDETEVSVTQYEACVAAACCTPVRLRATSCGEPGSGEQPVACVDWFQADSYCRWTGKRLPAEWEWEYAARGSEGRLYPWGDTAPDKEHANLGGIDDGVLVTAPVKSFSLGKTPTGLYNMAGNVWEWTASDYCPYPGGICLPPCSNCAAGTRVDRGGGWYSDPFSARGANRDHSPPDEATDRIGFRCARSAP